VQYKNKLLFQLTSAPEVAHWGSGYVISGNTPPGTRWEDSLSCLFP